MSYLELTFNLWKALILETEPCLFTTRGCGVGRGRSWCSNRCGWLGVSWSGRGGGEGSAAARPPGKAEGNARHLWSARAGGAAWGAARFGEDDQTRLGVVPVQGTPAPRRPRQALSEPRAEPPPPPRSGRGPPAPAEPRWIVGWGLRRPGGGLLRALRGPSRAGPVAWGGRRRRGELRRRGRWSRRGGGGGSPGGRGCGRGGGGSSGGGGAADPGETAGWQDTRARREGPAAAALPPSGAGLERAALCSRARWPAGAGRRREPGSGPARRAAAAAEQQSQRDVEGWRRRCTRPHLGLPPGTAGRCGMRAPPPPSPDPGLGGPSSPTPSVPSGSGGERVWAPVTAPRLPFPPPPALPSRRSPGSGPAAVPHCCRCRSRPRPSPGSRIPDRELAPLLRVQTFPLLPAGPSAPFGASNENKTLWRTLTLRTRCLAVWHCSLNSLILYLFNFFNSSFASYCLHGYKGGPSLSFVGCLGTFAWP